MGERVNATHQGPFGGMIVIVVEPGTKILSERGEVEVVTETSAVCSRKGALYVTPAMYERLKAAARPDEKGE